MPVRLPWWHTLRTMCFHTEVVKDKNLPQRTNIGITAAIQPGEDLMRSGYYSTLGFNETIVRNTTLCLTGAPQRFTQLPQNRLLQAQ